MGLLAKTMSSRLAAYVDRHAPTRVLVGGLPTRFLQALAEEWDRSRRLLIVTEKPNELQKSLRPYACGPDDLTAERQHAWVALVCADASRGIQESIRSAGAGTVREIWSSGFPWKACAIPGTRWEEVLQDFVVSIGLGAEKGAARCIQQFRKELTGEVDAPEQLFTSLDSITAGPISYEMLSYHLGLPRHSAGEQLRSNKAKDGAVLALADSFLKKFHEDGAEEALDQLLAANDEVHSSDAALRSNVEAALKHFAENFRRLAPSDSASAVRAWSQVFLSNLNHWKSLGTPVLRKL